MIELITTYSRWCYPWLWDIIAHINLIIFQNLHIFVIVSLITRP